jgi:surface protein
MNREGILGNCRWEFDDERCVLTISPIEGTDGMLGEAGEDGWPWCDFSYDICGVVIKDGVVACRDMSGMFKEIRCGSEDFDLSRLDTSHAENMSEMFSGCDRIEDLRPVKDWDVSKVSNMGHIFSGCSSLADISSLSKWNVGKVRDMSHMFCGCRFSNVLALRDWDVRNVRDMSYMFWGCVKLADIGPIAGWNTENIEDMWRMFHGCRQLADFSPIEDWYISDEARYMLITVKNPGCRIGSSFYSNKKEVRNAVIQDMLLYMGCASLHELQDAAAQGLCNFGLNGEFRAKTKDGYDAHWKVIKILVTDYESLFENGSRNWEIIG